MKDIESKTKMDNASCEERMCEESRKVLKLNHKLQRHPKCPIRRALHVNKDTEVVVEGAELPTNLFIEKSETDSIPRKRSV